MVAGFSRHDSRLVTAAEAKFNFATLTPVQQTLLNEYSDAIEKATAGDPCRHHQICVHHPGRRQL
jgi:hypothetical protein